MAGNGSPQCRDELPPGWTFDAASLTEGVIRDRTGRYVFETKSDKQIPWAAHVRYAWYRYAVGDGAMPSYHEWLKQGG